MEIKLDSTYKGTRILFGDSARTKRILIDKISSNLTIRGFQEIMIPIIQKQETFNSKIGDENQNMMYNFKDRGNRDLVLAPEYTAVVQQLALETFKYNKDIKMFYFGECFRGEKPQAGRWREFTQLGVEILNPTKDYTEELIEIALSLLSMHKTKNFLVNRDVTRGLDYYKEGIGFEISCEELGAQKQICGGGTYEGGIGFAIGIDRLLIL